MGTVGTTGRPLSPARAIAQCLEVISNPSLTSGEPERVSSLLMACGMATGLDVSMGSWVPSTYTDRKDETDLNSGTIPHLPLCVRYPTEDTEK